MGQLMNKWQMRKILNYIDVDDRENESIFVFGD